MKTGELDRLTRLFVLIGVVILVNLLGTVIWTANELLAADENSKPATEVLKSNSDSDVSNNQEPKGFGKSPSLDHLFDAIVEPIPFVICIDVSTTMLEESKGGIKGFMKVKDKAKYISDFLTDTSMFNIIAFAKNGTKTFQDKLVAGNEENKKDAKTFVEALVTGKEKDGYEVKVNPEDKSLFMQKEGDIFLKMLAKEYKGQYRWMKKL